MQVFNLKENEEISIGGNIKIMVRIKGQQVKFAINTPYKITVLRDDAKTIVRRWKMLIITRKAGESFQIGEKIRVTVLEIRGKEVWVKVEAPPEISILKVAK